MDPLLAVFLIAPFGIIIPLAAMWISARLPGQRGQ